MTDHDPQAGAWVVGASGLLGSAVLRRVRTLGRPVRTSRVAWHDHASAVSTLLADAGGGARQLFWCAGEAVVGSSADVVDAEVAVLEEFLSRWEPSEGRGLFFASSAGGVYAGAAGAAGAPFTEDTEPVALSPYGHAKLRAEAAVDAFAARTGTPVLVGRLSNLYGPGQQLTKPQGLVSQLCRAQMTRQPLSVYVPLDTRRDYLFVDDAAAMVVAGLDAVSERGGRHLKVIASERSTTVGAVIGDLRRLTRHRPPVVAGESVAARHQVRDLRFQSIAWPPLAGYARTSLIAGMAATLADVRSRGATLP